jgi:hypothetical protein
MALLNILSVAALTAAVAIAGDAVTAPDTNPTAAELVYADAPFGVDPMVTGPVSKGFETRRQMAGCDLARWPDIPLACYPD